MLLHFATNEKPVVSPTRVNCSTQLRRDGQRRGNVPGAQMRFPPTPSDQLDDQDTHFKT